MKRLEDLKVAIFTGKIGAEIEKSDLSLKDLTDEQVLNEGYLAGIDDDELDPVISTEEKKKRFQKDIDEFTANGIKLAKKLLIEEGLNPTKSEIEELKSVNLEAVTEDQKAIIAKRINKGFGTWDKWSDVNVILAKAATAIKVLNDIRLLTGLCKSSFVDIEKQNFSIQSNISKLMAFVNNSKEFGEIDPVKEYFDLGLEAKDKKEIDDMDTRIFNLIGGFCSGEYFYNGYERIEPLTKEDILNVHLEGKVILMSNDNGVRKLYLSKGYDMNVMYAPNNFVNLFVDKIRCRVDSEYNEDAIRILRDLDGKLETIVEQKGYNLGYDRVFDILIDYTDLEESRGYFQTLYGKRLYTKDGEWSDEILIEIFSGLIKNTIEVLSGDNHVPVLVEVKDRRSNLRQYYFNHILNIKTIALIERLLKVKPE